MTGKESVVNQLRNQAKKGSLAENVAISYQIQGGVGENRIDETVALTSPGRLRIKVDDKLMQKAQGETQAELKKKDTLDLFQTLLDGVENMVPASEARFVPDTLVGSVTFAIGNERETFYFEADEEDCDHRGQPIPPKIKSILTRMQQIESKHLRKTKGGTLQ